MLQRFYTSILEKKANQESGNEFTIGPLSLINKISNQGFEPIWRQGFYRFRPEE